MFYISVVMGALVGYLTDKWLNRVGVSDPVCFVVSVIVAVVVGVLTYVGTLAHF